MHTYDYSVEIAAPIEDVFAFDSNPENWRTTMSSLDDLEIIEETDDTVTLRATQHVLGQSIPVEMVRTIEEPNTRFVVSVEGDGTSGEVENRFVETETGTRIDHHSEFEYGDSLLDRIMEPIVARFNNRMFRTHLEHTRDLLEAEHAAETTIEA
jgi:carbon monoxide dehydrogenase subunit G